MCVIFDLFDAIHRLEQNHDLHKPQHCIAGHIALR